MKITLSQHRTNYKTKQTERVTRAFQLKGKIREKQQMQRILTKHSTLICTENETKKKMANGKSPSASMANQLKWKIKIKLERKLKRKIVYDLIIHNCIQQYELFSQQKQTRTKRKQRVYQNMLFYHIFVFPCTTLHNFAYYVLCCIPLILLSGLCSVCLCFIIYQICQ